MPNNPDWLTADYLRHLLHYDSLTGEWTWMNPVLRSKMRRGDPAGRLTNQGRRQIRIESGFFYASRLAWLYMTGEWPKDQIDHVNRIKSDDRWSNLREATQSQNSFNREWAEASGEWRGISKKCHKYYVDIGGMYHGNFDAFEEATAVRDQVLKELAGPFAVISNERKVS